MNGTDQYEVVIGLEVHAQLKTKTKLFCADTTVFGKEPNTQVSIISLGHPGTLPKMNKEVISMAVSLGLACHCEIVQNNYFARKNYFYPDLPKGYQVSQHTTPICKNGYLEIKAGDVNKKIRINRIHIEEDAGKSLHDEQSEFSNLDFNRAGMPLVEIVTEPDLRTAEEAFAYVTTLRKLVRHLQVCDGNMQEGSLRCDVNISVRKKGDEILGTKVEIKNLNSIRYIKKAIEHETKRLIDLHQKNIPILQETRGFDENDFTTYSIRTKEDEDDYRYFPEPDLPPFLISNEWIALIKDQMPPSQEEIKQKLINTYHLSEYDATQLSDDTELTNWFLDLINETTNYKSAVNWILGPVKNYLNENEISIDQFPVLPGSIAAIIRLIEEGKINYGTAVMNIFPGLIKTPSLNITGFIESNNLYMQTSLSEVDELIEAALQKHPEKIK
ncbi:MAG TPA: Asp-tRNA(Asn)/Glu-tRNA(Gln) amidotransferase subunit GatB, partial [Flavisolibacter sp.]|nr:Asp-tRNA(Asn)/Glu-tRNA(Gln) amidotransferase subunit GatB [Flavisolibacter sp.]